MASKPTGFSERFEVGLTPVYVVRRWAARTAVPLSPAFQVPPLPKPDLNPFRNAIAAMKQLGRASTHSGYRSFETQRKLWELHDRAVERAGPGIIIQSSDH